MKCIILLREHDTVEGDPKIPIIKEFEIRYFIQAEPFDSVKL